MKAARAQTKLDRILDRVTSQHEVTIDAGDLTPTEVERVYAAAKARGLHASGTRRWVLIRMPPRYTERHHSTISTVKSPAQLQREIDEALAKPTPSSKFKLPPGEAAAWAHKYFSEATTPDELAELRRTMMNPWSGAGRYFATRTGVAQSEINSVYQQHRARLGGADHPRAHATVKTYDAPKPDLSVRAINAIVRAADGRNIYLIRTRMGDETVQRITRARTKGRETEVQSLATGHWIPVLPERGDKLEVR